MTISEILSNEELRRREFPVAAEKIFLAHAGVCPLPRRVADAISDCAAKGTLGDQEEFMLSRLTDARKLGARLLNCQPEEVALVGPTSLGLSFVATGLKFKRGDNILIYHDDYPSNVYPWMSLAEKNVEVRLLNIRNLGIIRPRDVIGQIDESTTRLVARLPPVISSAVFRLEVAEIGKHPLRERGILFCLDAIQTLGAFPTTVEHVDFPLPPTPINGCWAPAVPAFSMCAVKCRINWPLKSMAGTTSAARILWRRKKLNSGAAMLANMKRGHKTSSALPA